MFPEINRIRKTSTYISVFRGLNRTPNAGFSQVASNTSAVYTEFEDMKNMGGDDYPKLCSRKKRSKVTLSNFNSADSNILIADNKIIYVNVNDTNTLYVDGICHSFGNPGEYEEDHKLVLYGNRVLIFPEKKYFDLETETFSDIEFSYNSNGVGESRLNVALFNQGNYIKRSQNPLRFRDFSIEKVAMDDNGKPYPVNYIYEKASGLEDYIKQTNPSNQNGSEGIDPWQSEYFTHWNTIRIGETVEAQGENPSGVYLCADILPGSEHTINGISYIARTNLRKFVKMENNYVRIFRKQTAPAEGAPEPNLFAGLKKGDWVKISGMEDDSVKKRLAINVDSSTSPAETKYWADVDGTTQGHIDYPSGFWGNYLEMLNNCFFKIYYVDENSIVIKANIDKSVPYTGPMKIERVMPELETEMMLEVGNRLWSCSSVSNEIFSSKLGDCTNWQAYGEGLSTDSYAATAGCEGEFTGIARQNDSVIFFKENWIMKLFGTKPGNFALTTHNVPGVERGSSRSVVWINGVLYYLSHLGVCQYSPGSQPVVISQQAFGNRKYTNGVAGRHRDKYYLSAQNELDEWELFVFDTATGLWHKEDDTHMMCCATYNNVLYFADDTGALHCCDEKHNLLEDYVGKSTEADFDWSFETPDLYGDDFGKKYVSKIQFAFKAEDDTKATVYAQFTQDGAWYELKRLYYTKRQHSMVGIPVRRSDYLRLRVEGTGGIEISGIQIDYARGSDKIWRY